MLYANSNSKHAYFLIITCIYKRKKYFLHYMPSSFYRFLIVIFIDNIMQAK